MRTHLTALWSSAGTLAIVLLLFMAPLERLHGTAHAQAFISPDGGADTTACLPDCFNSPWSAPKLHKVFIPPYGWFLVKYRTRYACNIWYDVYIDWIVPLNSSGSDPFATHGMQYILEIVTNFLLRENPMQFPPLPGANPPCFTNWRVIKGQCWSRVNTGNPQCPVQYVACDEQQCCLEPYQVCVDPSGQRTVTKMSYGYTPYTCSGYVAPMGGQPCEPACGYPVQYNPY